MEGISLYMYCICGGVDMLNLGGLAEWYFLGGLVLGLWGLWWVGYAIIFKGSGDSRRGMFPGWVVWFCFGGPFFGGWYVFEVRGEV